MDWYFSEAQIVLLAVQEVSRQYIAFRFSGEWTS
jgi:hypothetical protein